MLRKCPMGKFVFSNESQKWFTVWKRIGNATLISVVMTSMCKDPWRRGCIANTLSLEKEDVRTAYLYFDWLYSYMSCILILDFQASESQSHLHRQVIISMQSLNLLSPQWLRGSTRSWGRWSQSHIKVSVSKEHLVNETEMLYLLDILSSDGAWWTSIELLNCY
jgi:hypothetical protein